MHSNFIGAAIALLLTLFSANFAKVEKQNTSTTIFSETFEEIKQFRQLGKSVTVVDLAGNQYHNPDLATLQALSPSLFSENRIRLTLENTSEDNRCSTEIVLLNDKGGIVGNYSLNTCSSFGWIFFTPSKCFDIDLYHDAGLEAPSGNQVKGSVDWTFSFNRNPRLSGTYYDGGIANMIRVASPCYNKKIFTYQASHRKSIHSMPSSNQKWSKE